MRRFRSSDVVHALWTDIGYRRGPGELPWHGLAEHWAQPVVVTPTGAGNISPLTLCTVLTLTPRALATFSIRRRLLGGCESRLHSCCRLRPGELHAHGAHSVQSRIPRLRIISGSDSHKGRGRQPRPATCHPRASASEIWSECRLWVECRCPGLTTKLPLSWSECDLQTAALPSASRHAADRYTDPQGSTGTTSYSASRRWSASSDGFRTFDGFQVRVQSSTCSGAGAACGDAAGLWRLVL